MVLKFLQSVMVQFPLLLLCVVLSTIASSNHQANAQGQPPEPQIQPLEPEAPPQPSPQEIQAIQSAAQQAIAQLNQAQTSYYQRNQALANAVSTLQAEGGFTIPRQAYNFAVNPSGDRVFHYAVPRNLAYKAFVGAVFLQTNTQSAQPRFASVICPATQPGNALPPTPSFQAGRATCGRSQPTPDLAP